MALSKIKGTVIADDAINADRIADGTVVASDLLDNTITGAKLATDIAISTSGNITTTGALTSTGIDDNATSTAITINSSQQVGIGTTSPTSKLQVDGSTTINSAGSPPLTIHHTDGNTVALAFQNNASDNHSLMFTDGDFRINYDGSEKMRINSSGNVGINTSSPSARFNILESTVGTDPTSDSSNFIKLTNNDVSNSEVFGIGFSSLYGGTDYLGAFIQALGNYNANFNLSLIFGTRGTSGDATERMRIDSSGNVGIGGTPTNSSDHKSLALFGAANTGAGLIEFNDTSGNADALIFADDGNLYITADYDNTTASSTIRFRVDGSSEKMRIDSSGNVGIGTTSPSAILETKNATDGSTFAFQATNDNDHEIVQIGAQSDGDGYLTVHGQGASTNIKVQLHSDGISYFTGGNVGIGTTSPLTKLEVYNTSNGGVITAHRNSETAGDYTGYEFHTSSSATQFKKGAIYFIANGTGYGRGDIIFCNDRIADGANVSLADEKLRIADTGRIHTNATNSPGGHLNLIGERGSSYKAVIFEHTNGGGEVGNITTTSSAVSYNTSSDYRLKENVSYDFDATTRLKQLRPARFNFIADANTTVDGFLAHEVSSVVPEAISGEKDATETKEKVVVNANGQVIAENIEQADWEAGKIADENGNTQYPTDSTWEATKIVPVYQGIDQAKLVPLLVKTIQELEARITALEANNP